MPTAHPGSAPALRRAVFLDRDGTLNLDSPDYVKSAEELLVIPEAGPALARLARAGFLLIVITNQSAIARGKTTEQELARMHEKLSRTLAAAGAPLHDIVWCPHGPKDACKCRKPLPKMILDACVRHGIDAAQSFMVGDKETDIEAGRRAGCRTVLLAAIPPSGGTRADHTASGITAAAEWIIGRSEIPLGLPPGL
jgi:D-glycero-D-manno-heptose 1,7-bisphosphate phosphatase